MNTLSPSPGFVDNRLQILAVFAVSLLVYVLTTSHTVGLEDDGMFILSSWNGGVSHPPGYPFYALFGKLITSFPLGSVAFKAHLASGIFAAGAAAALWWCIRLLIPGSLPAWAGALAFAWSRTFWSQAIVAEVYTLNALFFFSLLALALQLIRYGNQSGPEVKRLLMASAFLAGLSFTNHWPLMVLASPALIILLWPYWRRVLALSPALIVLFVAGLLPYAWMVLRSQHAEAISFYGPIDSVFEFLFIFLRKGYSGVDQSGTDDLWDKLYFSVFFMRQLTVQMGLLGCVLAAFGLVYQAKYLGIRVSVALLAGFACSSFLLIALLGFDHSLFYEAIFRVYPLVAYGIMAIWLALGLYLSSTWLAEKLPQLQANHAQAGLGVLLVIPLLVVGWQHNDRSGFSYPADYGRLLLDSLPENAVLFAGDDVGFGTTAYLNLVEGVRPDVTIREPMGLVLPNRLIDPLTGNNDRYALALGHFASDSDRPVYIMGKSSPFSGMSHYGLYSRFQSDLDAETTYEIDAKLFEGWEQLLLAEHGDDEWLQIHRNSVSRAFGYSLMANPAETGNDIQQRIDSYPALARSIAGLTGMAQGLIDESNRKYTDELLGLLTRIEGLMTDSASINDRASYLGLSGAYFILINDLETAETFLLKSLSLWSNPKNPSFEQLVKLYEGQGRSQDVQKLRQDIQPDR